ncbi:MAG: biotin-dependent carboxyltransferase family protein [Fimbriimonadaceae bacterium]
MSAEVVRVAAGTTLQGLPRPGRRRFGVPIGGAFDRFAFHVLRAILGDSITVALEVPPPGIALRFDEPTTVGISGADAEVGLDGEPLGVLHRVTVPAESTVTLGPYRQGCRALVAWSGLEGVAGQATVAGDEFAARAARPAVLNLRLSQAWWVDEVRVLPGPDEADLAFLGRAPFRVSPHSNRVGLRLVGEPGPVLAEQSSEPTTFGVLQLARDRQLLAIGPDGPTVGGYPKIATVISADLDRLARLRPGDTFRFRVVDPEHAAEAARDQARQEDLALARLRIAMENGAP